MDLNFKRTQLSADIYGTQVKLTRPKFGRALELEKALKSAGTEDTSAQLKVMHDFLVECGCPAELIGELEIDHLSQLIAALSGSKKN